MKGQIRKAFITIILVLFSACLLADQETGFRWPNGARAAVNLAYDDALNSQLDNAIPALKWVKPYHDLDQISVDELREHIELANTMLYSIDGRSERTLTAPCGDLNAAGKNYIDVVKQEFVAIKAAFGGVTPDMSSLDPYSVGVAAPVGLSGVQLIDMVEEAAEKGTMANFTFHGIGGDHLSVSVEAHEQLLQYLAENSDIYWVDTFLNIMNYVKD